MAKKIAYSLLAIITLCLCCSVSFATDNQNSITLGNEVMRSIDKTKDSMDNVVSGNMLEDVRNTVSNGVTSVVNGIDNIEDDTTRMTNDVRTQGSENYNSTLTTTEGATQNTGINTMTTTTWMWIILAVAAIIIIAAIWYYATQENS